MTISKPYLTFIINLTLTILSVTIAYLTKWAIIIPLIFGIGFPLVNIEKPFKQKIGLTLVITIVTIVVFVATILIALSFNFDKYIFPGILAGLAGLGILGINGLIIDKIELSLRTSLLTFLLSGLSFPIWILLTENLIPTTFLNIELVRQFGVMLFWMTLTTIGVCLSIRTEKKDNKKTYR